MDKCEAIEIQKSNYFKGMYYRINTRLNGKLQWVYVEKTTLTRPPSGKFIVKVTKGSQITYYLGDRDNGRLYFDGGRWLFDGKSARMFLPRKVKWRDDLVSCKYRSKKSRWTRSVKIIFRCRPSFTQPPPVAKCGAKSKFRDDEGLD